MARWRASSRGPGARRARRRAPVCS
jgi:hypothetical protein